MKVFETLELEISKSICTVWLNRPALHNAMNRTMISELTEVFRGFSEEQDLRLIILRGKGKSFCAGADLNFMKDVASYGFDENLKESIELAQMLKTVYECEIPTIAVVHGTCFGGANGLISACDIAICDINTVFAFSEVKLGIAAANIAPFVIRRIGEYGARELMITGKRFKGDEAEKWKLVNHAFAENELIVELEKLQAQILSNAPNAVRVSKKLIRKIVNELHDELEITDYTTKLISELRASQEGQEGMASFLEKRKPYWSTD